MPLEDLSTDVLDAIRSIAIARGFKEHTLETTPISAVGENSYGLVLQAKITCALGSQDPFYCVIKIAPQNFARRQHMRVADYYQREVFMYDHVFKAFREIEEQEKIPIEHIFDSVPKMHFSHTKEMEEFIIFEDLGQSGFVQNARKNLPTYELTKHALKSLARFHAMSFVMQAKQPNQFESLINEIRFNDNLYTSNMDHVTIEFARKYVRRTLLMIAEDEDDDLSDEDQLKLINVVHIFKKQFKEIGLKSVNGAECAPYSVICHGDFWNNNILYRYDEFNNPTVAKLIDFQMSRYASPVLDVVHYLFACTEKDLRDVHFDEFLQIYYDALCQHLRLFNLNTDIVYPRAIFDSHLKTYGPYGFCMAIFAVPFFISDSNDIPDLDKASEAIHELSSEGSDNEDKDKQSAERKNNNTTEDIIKKTRQFVNKYELLTEKTIPVFKRRLIGIVQDLCKYDMVAELIEFSKQQDTRVVQMTAIDC